MLEFKSDVIKDVSSAKMSYSFAAVKVLRGGSRDVGDHSWLTKKILGFRWSKNAKITLETKAFGETFLSVFSNFLHFYK